MIVVIQCAATKQQGAGCLVSANGKRVVFVAHPEFVPTGDTRLYARPDDCCSDRRTWRDVLLEYNEQSKDNPLRLCSAHRLYDNRVYPRLVDALGLQNVYILSAGWGLIAADFLTPYYDITFSPKAEGYKRRRKGDRYRDFYMLPNQPDGDVVFLGGKDYVPLFSALTSSVRAKKIVFFNSSRPPEAEGCVLKRFPTSTRTNWHYECADALLDGRLL